MAPSPTRPDQDPRAALTDLYTAAVAAAAPGPALRSALLERGVPDRPVWLLALGKAAEPMARAAVETLRGWGTEPAGGLLVAPAEGPPPHPRLGVLAGDHPTPGPRSFTAARRLEAEVGMIPPDAEVWVLLSGGTTSLAAGPVTGVAPEDISALYDLLLGSGLAIAAMNRIRKRFSRWGGGRLAAALYPRPVRCFVVSDVIGDDLAAIGSGPCAPDDANATDVRVALTRAGLWKRLPPRLRNVVTGVEEGRQPETPKSGDPTFVAVQSRIVASNRLALEAAAARASTLGLRPVVMDDGLAGEASTVGADLANLLLRYPQGNGAQLPAVLIWGGETTVTLSDGAAGLGGRSQELALSAARVLGEAGRHGVALLAGGTDGRDGPTDAAGAIVDGTTWAAIRRRGRDPAADLRRHDAYHALDAAGVLLKPGMTGTNVMDVVIGFVGTTDAPPPAAGSPSRGSH